MSLICNYYEKSYNVKLVGEPDIILADEPTGALDQKTGEDILKLLKDINEAGKIVIIITHDSKVASYCKRRIVIQDGKIVEDAS